MSPGDAHVLARGADEPRQDGVRVQAFALVDFASVHVRLARVPSGADEEFRSQLLQATGDRGRVIVVDLAAAQSSEWDAAGAKELPERLADVAGCSKQCKHVQRLHVSR